MQKKVKQWDILVRKILIIEYLTFHDRGPNHKETSPQICRANQWTGFYTIEASIMKELNFC